MTMLENLYIRVMTETASCGYVRCNCNELCDVIEILDPEYWDRTANSIQWFDVNGDYVPQLDREPSESYAYDVGIEEWVNGSSIIVIHEVEV